MLRSRATVAVFVTSGLATFSSAASAQVPAPAVLNRGYNNQQTGENNLEPYLNQTNVSGLTRIGTLSVNDQLYAQPLYVPNVRVNVNGSWVSRNLIVAADTSNWVSVFDADTFQLVWHHQYGNNPVPCGWLPSGCGNYTGFVGIVGTPAIAVDANQFGGGPFDYTMYFVSRNAIFNGNWTYDLWAVNVGDGSQNSDVPLVGGTAGNTIRYSNFHGGWISFDPFHANQRQSLLVANGQVYVGFGSYGDKMPYNGWLLSYPISSSGNTLSSSPSGVFAVNAKTGGAGLWQAGRGPATDGYGNVFVATGNGTEDGVTEFGNSILEFGPTAPSNAYTWTPASYFFAGPSSGDLDVGANGPLYVQGDVLVVGKNGVFHSIAGPTQAGGALGPALVSAQIAGDPNASYDGNNHWPAFNDGVYSSQTSLFYSWTSHDVLRAYLYSNGQLNMSPYTTSDTSPQQEPGTGMAVTTACGDPGAICAGSRLVWATINVGGADPNTGDTTGGLVVYSADSVGTSFSLGNALYHSPDEDWLLAKWSPPTVAAGNVYVPTFSKMVAVYGLPSTPALFVDGSDQLHVAAIGRAHSVVEYDAVAQGASNQGNIVDITGQHSPSMNWNAVLPVVSYDPEPSPANYVANPSPPSYPVPSIDLSQVAGGTGSTASITWSGSTVDERSPAFFLDASAGVHVVALGNGGTSMLYTFLGGWPGATYQQQTISANTTLYSDPSMWVRSANPSDEIDVVAQGPFTSLLYYYGTPQDGGALSSPYTIPNVNCVSRPGIFVEPNGNAHVVSQGLNNSLWHCAAFPGALFQCDQIGANGSTFSAPQVLVRTANPAGEVDVVAQGPNGSVSYYHFFGRPSAPMTPNSIQGNITAVSAPSIAVASSGLVSVAVQALGTGAPVVLQASPNQGWTPISLALP